MSQFQKLLNVPLEDTFVALERIQGSADHNHALMLSLAKTLSTSAGEGMAARFLDVAVCYYRATCESLELVRMVERQKEELRNELRSVQESFVTFLTSKGA